MLDFHHASQHLWAIAGELHGQGTAIARRWAKGLLHSLRHGREQQVVRTLEELLRPKTPSPLSIPTLPVLPELSESSFRTPAKALEVGVEYFRTHREHLHYQRNARQGAPVGSGSVESLCSQLQNRFKRTGQFWSPSGLCHLPKLDVLNRNNNLQCLWN